MRGRGAGAALAGRIGRQREHHEHGGQHHDQELVGRQRGLDHRQLVHMRLGGRHRRELRMRGVALLEDQEAAHVDAGHRAERVEGLRDVQAARAGLARAHQRRIGIRGRLEEGQAGGDHEQRHQEHAVFGRRGGREEQQAAGGVEQQADQDGGLVAEFLHHRGGRDRQEEVAEIEGRLHEGRFEIGQEEGLLELRDQHVVEVGGGAPQREQAAQQREREQGRAIQVIAVGRLFDPGSAHGCLLPGVVSLSCLVDGRRRAQRPASRRKRSKPAASA